MSVSKKQLNKTASGLLLPATIQSDGTALIDGADTSVGLITGKFTEYASGDRVAVMRMRNALIAMASLDSFDGQGWKSGDLKMSASASAQTGWLKCDGSSVLRATYPTLFAAIGTSYGSVDGTHFTLPNFTSIFPMGNTPGASGGSATHTHTGPSHTHTSAAHSHSLSDNGAAAFTLATSGAGTIVVRKINATSWTATNDIGVSSNTTATNTIASGAALTGSTDSDTPGATGASGTGATGATSTLPPYTGVCFFIKI